MPKPRKRKGMTAEIALSLISKTIEIQKKYPETAKKIDNLQARLLETLEEIRRELEGFNEREREIFTVSIINFIHEKTDETLLD
jgi:hypothetical protein